MSHSQFCSGCQRHVGPTGKRGHFVLFAMLTVISVAAIFTAQLAILPSPTEQYLASKYGMPLDTHTISPFWYLLPVYFAMLSVRSFFTKQSVCPLCSLPLGDQ